MMLRTIGCAGLGLLAASALDLTAVAQVAGPLEPGAPTERLATPPVPTSAHISQHAASKNAPSKSAPSKSTASNALSARRRVAAKPKPAIDEPWAAVDPGRVVRTPPPEQASPAMDPKAAAIDDARGVGRPDLAMKWNGNNDTATQTRVQNYGGEAEGAGAAMGLKFHF